MNFNHPQVGRLINESVKIYESVVRGIDDSAQMQNERAYGGVVRASKGKMVETMAKNLTQAAGAGSGNDKERLKFNLHRKYKIPIKSEQVDNTADDEMRNEILAHIQEYNIKHGTDVHV